MTRDWIQTFTGKRVNPLKLRVEDINIIDIAHALSNQGRFTGHTKFFYSVGQHSLAVAHLVQPEFALEALLHDASEAYLGDVAKPMKNKSMYKQYREVEDRIEKKIAKRFNLPYPISKEVKVWDQRVGAEEAYQLMNADDGWGEWFTQQDRIEGHVIGEYRNDFIKRQFLYAFEGLYRE